MRVAGCRASCEGALIDGKCTVGIEFPNKRTCILAQKFGGELRVDPKQVLLRDRGCPIANQRLLGIGRDRCTYGRCCRCAGCKQSNDEQHNEHQMEKTIGEHFDLLLKYVICLMTS